MNLIDFADLSPCNICETKAGSRISDCFSKIKMKTEKSKRNILLTQLRLQAKVRQKVHRKFEKLIALSKRFWVAEC